jgi:23S rRNA maturation mini-RNase III
MPLCTIRENKSGNEELLLISGHHRTRAARKAGIMEIHVMVIQDELNDDYIFSKQLAHNSLNGGDDSQVLAQIYNSIRDIEAKIASGINNSDLKNSMDQIDIEEIALQIDFEIVNILFLPEQKQKFDDILKLITAKEDIYVSDIGSFNNFKEQVRKIAKKYNIRNISSILNKMMEIVENHYEVEDANQG